MGVSICRYVTEHDIAMSVDTYVPRHDAQSECHVYLSRVHTYLHTYISAGSIYVVCASLCASRGLAKHALILQQRRTVSCATLHGAPLRDQASRHVKVRPGGAGVRQRHDSGAMPLPASRGLAAEAFASCFTRFAWRARRCRHDLDRSRVESV
jgi:hypothetical protein